MEQVPISDNSRPDTSGRNEFWDSIIEQIEQFRRENRFGSVQLKIRNHEIVHFEMSPVRRGKLPDKSWTGPKQRDQRDRTDR